MKKDKRQATADSATISTLLGRDTMIEGTLTFKETIRVDGEIKGKLISPEGTLIVGEHAALDADIKVGVAIVRGKVTGRVEAGQRIELYSPAQVTGDISAPSIAIDTGVVFNGNCAMQGEAPSPSKKLEKSGKPASAEAPEDQKLQKTFDN